MKRLLIPLIAVLLLVAGGIYLQRHVAPHPRQVAEWLPSTTVLFEDVPDIHRTIERWPETALAQIIDEPEVQAFLEKPLGEIPDRPEVDQRLAQLRRIDPLHIFFAVTALGDADPSSAILGIDYAGSRQDLDSLVDELRKQVLKSFPAGKSSIEKYNSDDVEIFTSPTFSAALAYHGPWLFIATDTAALKSMLDRVSGAQHYADSLAELPAFKRALHNLPGGPDNLFFLRPALLADKASSLALMLNPTGDAHGADGLKKIESISLAFKFDGEIMRDALYVAETGAADSASSPEPLSRDAFRLSTRDTIVAGSSRVQLSGSTALPDTKSDPSGVLALLSSYAKTFADRGLGAPELAQAFGPESGFLIDWPAGAMIPAPLGMLDVRDPVLARKFLDTLSTLPLAAGVDFTHQDAGGISFYSLPQTGFGFFQAQFTLGLTKKAIIGAISPDAVKQAALRWDAAGSQGIDSTEAYKTASALVAQPTESFTYVDTKSIFERGYAVFRLASMLIPHLSEYIDINKLPAPEVISRHLTPMVASTSRKEGGLLMESAGSITPVQAGAVALVSAGALAFPYIEQQLKGQCVSLQGMPGFGIKSSGTPPFSFTSPSVPTPLPALSPGAPPAPASPAAPAASPSGGTP